MRTLRFFPAPPPRYRRDGWTADKRVTFCVNLAASGSVTFAAASVGLSRKSAYALKKRDRAFASLWEQALAAGGSAHRRARRVAAGKRRKGNGAHIESIVKRTPGQGDRRAADEAARNRFFRALELGVPASSRRRDSQPLLPSSTNRRTMDVSVRLPRLARNSRAR